VIDAQTGAEVGRGSVPANSVAVTASRTRRFGNYEFGLPCVLVIKEQPDGVRHDKSELNDILREHGASL
jgi:2,3,4,5-tetrahydropyridine-2-carboxylate N-succinyltransferase